MQYTKYIATAAIFSLVSFSAVTLAATGTTSTVTSTGITTTSTMVTSTGITAGGVVVPVTSSLEVKGAPRLVKKTTDSVVLEWDTVPSASAYIVKYSKASIANSTDPNAQYDNETDQVTVTGAVVTKLSSSNEKLSPATSYYFSVVAIDKEGKESDTFSDELMVTTEASGTMVSTGSIVTTMAASTLAIKNVAVSDDKTLTLSFNTPLSADPVRVKITKTSDNSDVSVGTVVQDSANPAAVIVTTIAALSPASSYTLTVLSAKDAAGNTIQEGVNGINEFKTLETLKASSVTAATPMTLAAAGSESGSTLSGAVSPESATKVATGAKENIIVLAALILSLGIVAIYRRKLI